MLADLLNWCGALLVVAKSNLQWSVAHISGLASPIISLLSSIPPFITMAGATVEALLSVSSALLDRSEPLYAELKRLASSAEGASAACRSTLRAGTASSDATAVSSAAVGGAAAATAAATAAAADARAAADALSTQAESAKSTAAKRLAEDEARELSIEADAASFSASLATRRRELEAEHKEKVKAILAANGLSG